MLLVERMAGCLIYNMTYSSHWSLSITPLRKCFTFITGNPISGQHSVKSFSVLKTEKQSRAQAVQMQNSMQNATKYGTCEA